MPEQQDMFKEDPVKKVPEAKPPGREIDWEQRRYEIASGFMMRRVLSAKTAVEEADNLIFELKKEKEVPF